MSTPRTAVYPWLETVLALFLLWASVEAVLVWWREPKPAPALPARMQLQGRWYARLPATPSPPDLPSGVVVVRAADYQAPTGQRLALRWLANSSSGSGIRLEPDKLSRLLLGEGRRGVCRVYNAQTGRLLGTASNGSDVRALLRPTNPRGLALLQWSFGLRPWRENRCLFVGLAARRT